MPFLQTLVILLAAAVLAVPLAKRLGFGSVLGYLAAGLVIGPAGLRLVTEVEDISHASEMGVIMLLFLIGLELRPARLWVMRRSVLGLGAAQVILTSLAIAGLCKIFGIGWATASVIGFGLALSSTAIILPLLAERDLLTSHAGRDSFAVLLFQDIAVIPAVALLPLLDGDMAGVIHAGGWMATVKAAGAILLVLVGGKFLIRPIFRLVDKAKAPEIFTATALLVVMGTATLVNAAGVSMSLGAFMAGVLLSDSEYRHELRADIEPFEGILLGVFFVSVGMSAELSLFLWQPFVIIGATVALILIKCAIGFVLARIAGQDLLNSTRFAFLLAQGGEFAFVLFASATGEGVMASETAALAKLVVTLSMIATPLLFAAEERWLGSRLTPKPQRDFDTIEEPTAPVIICGFGRVGQIVGRILSLRGIEYTALDKDAEQVDFVRRFGVSAYYGDPTRVDLLRAAGGAQAKILVVALDDATETLKVVENAKRYFPNLYVLARARNRRHYHLLMDLKPQEIVRETFHSSLRMTELVLKEIGLEEPDIGRTLKLFKEHDERTLVRQHAIYRDEKQLIQSSKDAVDELRLLFEADLKDRLNEAKTDAAR